jgi:hypothetical protein
LIHSNKIFFFFSDFRNYRIRKVNLLTNIITTFAGIGNTGYNGDNIIALNTNFFNAYCVRFDKNGNFLYYIDVTEMVRIRKINMATTIVSTIYDKGMGDVYFFTIENVNNIYNAERSGNRILKFNSVTRFFFFFFFFFFYIVF